jgi:MFS family permease
LGFFAFSRVDNLVEFYGAYLIISLGSSIGGFITINAALANWFDKKRTMAMGLASTGWGTAGLLVPVVALALGVFGWRDTAFWSGIIILVIGLPLAQLFRYAPEPYGYLPDGEKPAEERQDDGLPATSRPILALVAKGFTARQALKAPSFWYISLGHATAMLAVSAINALLIPYLTESMDISVFQAALVVMLLTVIMVAGQATIGFLGDRFEKRKIIVVCMVGHTVALVILAFAQTLPMVVLFAVIHGIAWGFRGPLMTAIRADYFGRGSFATIMGFSSLIIQMGTMIGPLFGAFVADVTGSFAPAFGVIAVFTAVGAFLFNAARKPEMPETPVTSADPESESASATAC